MTEDVRYFSNSELTTWKGKAESMEQMLRTREAFNYILIGEK